MMAGKCNAASGYHDHDDCDGTEDVKTKLREWGAVLGEHAKDGVTQRSQPVVQ
jgi:hypothetical protein